MLKVLNCQNGAILDETVQHIEEVEHHLSLKKWSEHIVEVILRLVIDNVGLRFRLSGLLRGRGSGVKCHRIHRKNRSLVLH